MNEGDVEPELLGETVAERAQAKGYRELELRAQRDAEPFFLGAGFSPLASERLIAYPRTLARPV